jgi:hypothetical protein
VSETRSRSRSYHRSARNGWNMRMDYEIQLIGIETGAGEYYRVTFRVTAGTMSFDVAVPIRRGSYDDADLVRVARHGLYEIAARVAAQTQGWQLDEQERIRLQMPGATSA